MLAMLNCVSRITNHVAGFDGMKGGAFTETAAIVGVVVTARGCVEADAILTMSQSIEKFFEL